MEGRGTLQMCIKSGGCCYCHCLYNPAHLETFLPRSHTHPIRVPVLCSKRLQVSSVRPVDPPLSCPEAEGRGG